MPSRKPARRADAPATALLVCALFAVCMVTIAHESPRLRGGASTSKTICPACSMESRSYAVALKNGQRVFACSKNHAKLVEDYPKDFVLDKPDDVDKNSINQGGGCPACGMTATENPVQFKNGQQAFSCSKDHQTELHDDFKGYSVGVLDNTGGMGGGGMGGGMQMFFVQSIHNTILFEGWQTNTTFEYYASCFAIFVIAAVAMGLHALRESLFKLKPASTKDASMLQPLSPGGKTSTRHLWGTSLLRRVVKTLLFIVHMTLAYWLMLITMTYDVGLFSSVVLGLSLGYGVFFAGDQNDIEPGEPCCS